MKLTQKPTLHVNCGTLHFTAICLVVRKNVKHSVKIKGIVKGTLPSCVVKTTLFYRISKKELNCRMFDTFKPLGAREACTILFVFKCCHIVIIVTVFNFR